MKTKKQKIFTILLSLMAAIVLMNYLYPYLIVGKKTSTMNGALPPPEEISVTDGTINSTATDTDTNSSMEAARAVLQDTKSTVSKAVSSTIEKVVPSVSPELVSSGDRVYTAIASYNYIDNKQKKSSEQIFSELTSLARDPCDANVTTSCYKKQTVTAISQNYILDNQYFYYLYPVSFGRIDYSSLSTGFLINQFHDNSLVEKILTVKGKDGTPEKYYLYGYQSDDGTHLGYQPSGLMKITAP